MEPPSGIDRFRGIGFISSYVPRPCGIATFTDDLANAVVQESRGRQSVIVAAMNDRPQGYAYPNRVKFEIRQDYTVDYSRAADFLNFSRIDVLSLQHEYGIFGGEYGANVLTLMRDLHRPVVVTCHTVVQDADPAKKEVFDEIAARADKLVVMSARAGQLIEDIHRVRRDKIVHIPHGIHDVPFIDPNYFKDKFGVEGRRVILTFGLLHENKGIEYMIEALPDIVAKHPRTTYLVLGVTHPAIVRRDGEAYRLMLQRRVRELGLEEYVLFHPRYVELDELLEYLGAAEIFVSPYIHEEHSTSGALAYAMGSGKAVVSTPFWYAKELLAEQRGSLVPFNDPEALSREIISLLDDEVTLNAIRKRAYTFCRSMVWPAVARGYLELFDQVRSQVPKTLPTASAMKSPISASNLPVPKLDHLLRLSDDTGPAHYARHTLPDWVHGYHLEDAANVSVASSKYHEVFGDAAAVRLTETCLALLQTLVGTGETVAQGLDYTRQRMGNASQVDIGKAIWALGFLVNRKSWLVVEPAYDLFHQLLPHANLTEPQGVAYALLGAANYLQRFPGALEVRRYLTSSAARLRADCGESCGLQVWPWPDRAVVAQALTAAAAALMDDGIRTCASSMIEQLRETTSNGTVFLKPGENPEGEELPIVAATFIEAVGSAFRNTRERELLEPIRSAADWFLGANRVGQALYDFKTGGCHDALTPSGPNRNQGTQATAFCILAFTSLHELAGSDAGSTLLDATPTSEGSLFGEDERAGFQPDAAR
ncbi:MAG: glycosyltransferase family 4 protein [Candidatus Krumholzibacteria bacterium]|nr:glycosyltransferase family 4 protein [Candidatus Krumholzibacteria bacterium]